MNICEIIFKTKRKEKLNEDEIKCMINGYVNDEIPDLSDVSMAYGGLFQFSYH